MGSEIRDAGMKGIAIVLCSVIVAAWLSGCASEPVKPPVPKSDNLYSGQPRAVYGTEFPAGSAPEAALRGDAALAKGDMDRALYFYVESLNIEPAQVPTLLKIGAIQRQRGDQDRALAAYRRVLAIEPENVNALEGTGLVHLDRRAHDSAGELLGRAVARDPNRWRAFEGLGVLADLRGDHAKAIENYAAALKVRPDRASLYSNRGYSRYLAGDLAGAEADFRAALGVDPGFDRAWRNLGLLYVRKKRYEDALATFGRVEDRAAALNDVGYLAMLEGDYATAESYLSEAISTSPTYYRVADENLARTRQRRSQAVTAATKGAGDQ
jgi:tetratricopeptide (TPR) repeat protein